MDRRLEVLAHRARLVIDIDCPRCRSHHRELTFNPLAHPADRYDWWAICPRTNQPILIARLPDVDGSHGY